MTQENTNVTVNSFYFSKGATKTFPRAIEFQGRLVTFKDGLQYVVRRGEAVVRLFDMSASDGTYRLRCEDNNWTLLATKGAI